MSRMTKYT